MADFDLIAAMEQALKVEAKREREWEQSRDTRLEGPIKLIGAWRLKVRGWQLASAKRRGALSPTNLEVYADERLPYFSYQLGFERHRADEIAGLLVEIYPEMLKVSNVNVYFGGWEGDLRKSVKRLRVTYTVS